MRVQKTVYTNENYEVQVALDFNGYDVFNIQTSVIEENVSTLPHALALAEQMNLVLLQEEWRKYAQQMYPHTTSNVVNLVDTDKVN